MIIEKNVYQIYRGPPFRWVGEWRAERTIPRLSMKNMIYRWLNGHHIDLLYRRRRREGVEAFYTSRNRVLYGFDRNLFDAC